MTDIETSLKLSKELKQAFAELYPLALEADLPTAACHIKRFLQDRLQKELDRNTQAFAGSIARVLCEVTHPKTHLVDMARNVVNELESLRRFRDSMLADAEVNLREDFQERLEEMTTDDVRKYFTSVRERAKRTLS